MRDLSHKRVRFNNIITDCADILNYNTQKEKLTYTAGVLNTIWNSWNNFWREYWLAIVAGGYDLSKNKIIPIFPTYTDKQACHYLLHACGKRRRHNFEDSINSSHQEATWGDPKIISDIATFLGQHHTHLNSHMTYVVGLLNHYQVIIEHVQQIRNSFIHLNNENVNRLNTIMAYYSFSMNQGLLDILDSTNINTGTRCFDNILDNLKGMVNNL